jgi:hypothetical protein
MQADGFAAAGFLRYTAQQKVVLAWAARPMQGGGMVVASVRN